MRRIKTQKTESAPSRTSLSPSFEECSRCSQDILKWTIIANLFLALVKFAGGILSNSIGLFADGTQSVCNIIASSIISYSIALSQKGGDAKYPYGYGKFEYVVALAVYSLLFGLGLAVSAASFVLMFSPRAEGPGLVGLPIGLIAVFVTYLQYRYNYCAGEKLKSCGIVANAVNAKADMLTSVAASIGIVLSQLGPQLAFFDAFAALVVGLVVLKDASSLWLANLKLILDQAPEPGHEERIRKTVAEVFEGASRLLKWKRVGKRFWIGLGLEVPEGVSIQDAERMQAEVKKQLLARVEWVEEVSFFLITGVA